MNVHPVPNSLDRQPDVTCSEPFAGMTTDCFMKFAPKPANSFHHINLHDLAGTCPNVAEMFTSGHLGRSRTAASMNILYESLHPFPRSTYFELIANSLTRTTRAPALKTLTGAEDDSGLTSQSTAKSPLDFITSLHLSGTISDQQWETYLTLHNLVRILATLASFNTDIGIAQQSYTAIHQLSSRHRIEPGLPGLQHS